MPHKLDYQNPADRAETIPSYVGIASLLLGCLSMVFVAFQCGGVLPARFRVDLFIDALPCLGFLCGVISLIGDRRKSFAWLGMLINGIVLSLLAGEMLFAKWMFGGMTW